MSDLVAPPCGHSERRRAPRMALRLMATAREPRRSRSSIRLIDISPHGCRIELTSSSLSEPWIWLNITGLEAQYCRVVWHENDFAGLEFAAPLNEAVLDSLLAKNERPSVAAIQELRQIAARTSRIVAQAEVSTWSTMLTDLSRDCALQAIVQALELSEVASEQDATPQLTGSMIRRTVSESLAASVVT